MQAIMRVDVPDWQIGEKVSVYFPDSMMIHSVCEQVQPIGKWIGGTICSTCNYKKMFLWQYNYCPKCGTRLEVEEC